MKSDSAVKDARDGVVAGLICYLLWGVLPVYIKLLQTVAPTEIVLHRIIWAVPFGALIIHFRKQWPEVRRALSHRTMLLWLATAALFIAVNWLIYIAAVQHAKIFQASLGYYINPLMFVLVGVAFLGEKLRGLQTGAVILAAVGVLVLTFSGGEFPAISLALGLSFTVYGVIRKRIVIGAMPGLFVETLILFPIAISAFLWMAQAGQASFGFGGASISGLLMLGGPVTVIPLLLFAIAARRLTLTTIGFMQFLAPTLQFCMGLYYGEVLTTPRLVCFVCIWTAVVLFSADAVRNNRRQLIAPAA